MELFIRGMHIENFKGVTAPVDVSFTKRTHVFGRNKAGKTTLADAYYWVLFNKDSNGNTPGSDSFREKPLDGENHEIHNLETTVTLDCMLDGAPFTLRRTQKENWVKARGKMESVFQGNVSSYWINEVPMLQQEFKSKLSAICPDEVFLYLSTLSAFNAAPWEKRRNILLANVSASIDSQLLSKPEYAQLAQLTAEQGVGVDSFRKTLKERIALIKGEIKDVDTRIKEQRRSIPDIKDADVRDAKYAVTLHTDNIARLDAQIASVRGASPEIASAANRLSLESEKLSIQRRMMYALTEQARIRSQTIQSLNSSKARLYSVSDGNRRNIAMLTTKMEKDIAEKTKKRDDYFSVKASMFVPATEDRCPTCLQPLPKAHVQAAIEKAQKQFDAEKTEKLAAIKDAGVSLGKEIAYYQEQIKTAEAALISSEKELADVTSELEAAKALDVSVQPTVDYSSDPRYVEICADIERIAANVSDDPAEKIKPLQAERASASALLAEAQAVLNRKAAAEAIEKRLIELCEKQNSLGNDSADAETLMILCEQFVKDRCGYLEPGINMLFPTVKWKLFDTQINGGVIEVCNCLCEGNNGALVPYGGANTAAKLNADIEIINVLSAHYGITLPLFIEDPERVNVMTPPNGQSILLSVSENEKLRIIAE